LGKAREWRSGCGDLPLCHLLLVPGPQPEHLAEIRPQALGGFTQFDGYEIAPYLRPEESDSPGRFYDEACDAADVDVWSLYGRIPGLGVEAISEFDKREHAEEVYARIPGERYGG